MAVVTLPNMTRLVTTLLAADADVDALVDGRVFNVLPTGDKTWPTVRVTRQGGGLRTQTAYHLDSAVMQIEAWAGPAVLAWQVAETCRAVMATRFVGAHDIGDDLVVVTGVDVGGMSEDKDEAHTPAPHRARFDAVIYAHPG